MINSFRTKRFFGFLSSFSVLALISGVHCGPPQNGNRDVPTDTQGDTTPLDGADVTMDQNQPDNPPTDTPGDTVPDGDGGGGGPRTMTPPRITTCPGDSLPSLPSGTCSVTAGSQALLITGDILTPGEVFRGGQVAVNAAGMIQCVGCDCSAMGAGATQITCPDGVVSPGLINTHDHMTFVQNPPYTRTAERYEQRHDWRRGQRGHTEVGARGFASGDQMAWGELRFILGGATSTNSSGGINGFLRNLDGSSTQGGLNQTPVEYDTFPLGDSSGTQLTSGCAYPMLNTAMAIANEDAYTPHVSEGIDTAARNEFLCLRSGANDLVQPQSAFIHGTALLPPDMAEMATDETSLIWSPRSNITLYGDTARVTEYWRVGVTIALGTDWMPTGSMNMLRELRCADDLNTIFYDNFFTDEALWLMATRDAAVATATDDVIGILAPNHVADISIFNARTRRDHRAIISAEPQDVALVMRAGKALYGDQSLVSMLPGGAMCDTLDVCGSSKLVCVSSESTTGRTLASLTTANAGLYPLFFCGTPPMNEPSCSPERNANSPLPNPVVNGSTRYTGASDPNDTDGDGIANAMDNCPRVFNPIRPVDNGRQGDYDNDNVGDACDPCPLDMGTTMCSGPNPDDRDRDTIPNATDNCPDAPNMNQSDRDNDMIGDVCDPCPDTANPPGTACPTTIYNVKNGMVAVGATVSLRDAIVTAVRGNGFYMQVNPTSPTFTSPDYSGVFVFTGAAPTAAVGDIVSISTATVTDFFGQTQLTQPTVMVVSSGNPVPNPVDVTATDVTTGGPRAAQLEGVFVRVQNVTVTNPNPPPAGGEMAPTNEFEINSVLRVDDLLYLVTPFPAMNEMFASISGIMAFVRSNNKLEPRGPQDYVGGTPVLLPFDTALSYTRVGPSAVPTVPNQLRVTLSRAVAADTPVTLSSSGAGLVVSNVMIMAGMSSAPVLVQGVTASTTPYTITADFGGMMQTTQVRVIDTNETPRLVSLSPGTATVPLGGTTTFTVGLDIPAPTGGTNIMLSVDMGGSVPGMITVPADQLTAPLTFTAGNMMATSTITATLNGDMRTATANVTAGAGGSLVINEVDYDQVGTDAAEFVEIYNKSSNSVDLTGMRLVFVNGSNNTSYQVVALSGMLEAGAYLVAGNMGVTVPPTVRLITFPDGSLQNGAPDGILLLDSTNAVLDALSYEGGITNATVMGITGTSFNLVEGMMLPASVADSNTTNQSVCRLPNGSDTNQAATDWRICPTITPGDANVP